MLAYAKNTINLIAQVKNEGHIIGEIGKIN